MPKTGGSATGRHRFAIVLHDHPAQSQIEILQRASRPAQHVQTGGSIIGDRVVNIDLPVGDSTAGNFQRRHDVIDRPRHIGQTGLLHRQRFPQDQRDFTFNLRLHETFERNLFAVLIFGIGPEHSEVGLIDA